MIILLQIIFGILFANLVEVLAHKYVLHYLGMRKNSFFSHHWKIHHRAARKNNFYDPGYLLPWWSWNARSKEILSILVLDLFFLPFFFYFQIFTIILWLYSLAYLVLHKYMHIYPDMAKKYFPWHYDHHSLKNQNKNWGVLLPIWDIILGSRGKHD